MSKRVSVTSNGEVVGEKRVNYLLSKAADIYSGHVQIKVRQDGRVVWVNVDGICVCRICAITKLELVDNRR